MRWKAAKNWIIFLKRYFVKFRENLIIKRKQYYENSRENLTNALKVIIFLNVKIKSYKY